MNRPGLSLPVINGPLPGRDGFSAEPSSREQGPRSVRSVENRRKLRGLLARDAGALTPAESAFRKALLADVKATASHFGDVLLDGHRKSLRRSLLIKPVGDGCNYRCDYCFHHDVLERLDRISLESVASIYRSARDALGDNVQFIWHGGEPTLAGFRFFESAIALQEVVFGRVVENAIQTNGSRLDQDWIDFFKTHRFDVGLSLDGLGEAHDRHRRDAGGGGTFERTTRAMRLLHEGGCPFGVIAVVSAGAAAEGAGAAGLYDFVSELGASSISTNPAAVSHDHGIAPTAEEYGAFVIALIDRWLERGGEGAKVSEVVNFLGGLIGGWQPICYLTGACSHFLTVQKDGWVKACCDRDTDRLRNPETYVGNVFEDGLKSILEGPRLGAFAAEADVNPVSCAGCEWLGMCRGGCSHHRLVGGGRLSAHDPFCQAYKRIFAHLQAQLDRLGDPAPSGGAE
jgi:uncharacterized protein